MVFQISMLDWIKGWGVNLPWVYVHCAIYETYLVSWFSKDLCSLGGGGSICHRYMCICAIYIWNLIWCNGFPKIYAPLEERVRSICHRYMCIVLYMKLIWCNGFPEIYAGLEEGGQSAIGICALCYIYLKLIWCNGFPKIYAQLEGDGVNLPWVYVHCAIYETYLVSWFSRDLCSLGGRGWGQSAMDICAFVPYISETYSGVIVSKDLCSLGGGGGVNLPWVYVHCAI